MLPFWRPKPICKSAQINLGYTDITSPIAGKISRTSVTVGNVVGPDKGTLTTIVSQDPMYVTFPVSLREFLSVSQTSQLPSLESFKVKLRYSNGLFYDQVGTVNFLDVMANRETDTVLARATVANPKGGIIDGQLLTVIVETREPAQRIVIPQSALIADQAGIYVFVVEDGKAVTKRVKAGRANGTGVVVDSGLDRRRAGHCRRIAKRPAWRCGSRQLLLFRRRAGARQCCQQSLLIDPGSQ